MEVLPPRETLWGFCGGTEKRGIRRSFVCALWAVVIVLFGASWQAGKAVAEHRAAVEMCRILRLVQALDGGMGAVVQVAAPKIVEDVVNCGVTGGDK